MAWHILWFNIKNYCVLLCVVCIFVVNMENWCLVYFNGDDDNNVDEVK